MVTWRNLVRPQQYCSDTATLVEMAEARWGVPRPRPSDHAAAFGRLALAEPDQAVSPVHVPALQDPALPQIVAAMARWPEAWEGFQRFVTTFWPLQQAGMAGVRGSTSGHTVRDGCRIVYVTVFDVEGCRAGLLHEWAHLRLEALGVDLESHDGVLLANDLGERYISPIRRDVLRPMSAVLHGVYAWAMLSAGDLIAAEQGHADAVTAFISTNVPKLEEGILTLEQHSRWTPDGQPFGDELRQWLAELVPQMWKHVPGSPDAVRAKHRAWVESQPISGSLLYGTA